MAESAKQGEKEADRWVRHALHNEHLTAEVIPALGGKVASLALAGEGGTFLQGPLTPYAERTATMPFDQSDASGWDECLPSIGPCSVTMGDGTAVRIEDHGDVWRTGWTVEEATDELIRTRVQATSLPLVFERTLRLAGANLHAHYTVRNTGQVAAPYGWSIHPLFAVEPMDRIVLPPSVEKVTAQSSANGRLGKGGSAHPWPLTKDANDGEPLDLSIAGAADEGVADKLVLPSPPEGWCALDRIPLRTRLTVHFDPKQLPWLGLWLCYGGWPKSAQKKGYTVALEPCNLPADSLATSLEQGAGATLGPGEQASWKLRIELTRLEER